MNFCSLRQVQRSHIINVDLEIIHQDDSLLVINKPACIHTVDLPHGRTSRSGISLAQLLKAQFTELESASEQPHDQGCVNRLDYETSGLVVVARSREYWHDLHRQFTQRQVEKIYLTKLEGKLADKIEVDTPLGTRAKSAKRVYPIKVVRKGYKIFEATTIFTPLSYDKVSDSSLVEVSALGGVRHQIRAHAASILHPLKGDSLYGAKTKLSENDPPFALHALRYLFKHPKTKTSFEISAAAPSYLT